MIFVFQVWKSRSSRTIVKDPMKKEIMILILKMKMVSFARNKVSQRESLAL